MRSCLAVVCSLIALICPARALAEPGLPLADRKEGDDWRSDVDVAVRIDALGFESAYVFSRDGRGDANGMVADIPEARSEARGRISLYGRWLHLEIQGYVHIPASYFGVSDVGLEGWLMVPVTEWLRFGFYHHSAHNISDGHLGYGIDLNAMTAEASLWTGNFSLLGDDGRFRIRTLGYYFISVGDGASPYVWTQDTNVGIHDIGDTSWRGAVQFDAAHPRGRLECTVTTQAEKWVPVSLQAGCMLGAKLGSGVFGAAGEHLLVGPYGSYRVNFSRTNEFGLHSYSVGVAFDLLFNDDPIVNRQTP